MITDTEARDIKEAVLRSPRDPGQTHAEFASALIAAFAVVDAALVPDVDKLPADPAAE